MRNRQNGTELPDQHLFSAESKPKPSLSSLRYSLGDQQLRMMRVLALVGASFVTVLYIVYWSVGGHAFSESPLDIPRRPSLSDYPEVLVADSKPFKDDLSLGGEHKSVAKSLPAGDSRVRALSHDAIPPGVDQSTAPHLRIIVLTMDREASLRRLLRSLDSAEYGGDRVDLDIWIDRGSSTADAEKTMESIASASMERIWKHGVRSVHRRTENAGLYEQWIYTWNITESTTEACVILEDDLEVSPSFYLWLKEARKLYASDPSVAAFTLQRAELRPRQIPGVASGKLHVDSKFPVFKYRLLGTWGFAPEKRAWLEFRTWYEEMRASGARPYVDNLMTTSWYKSQEKGGPIAKTMWSQWFIKFADVNDYFTVYANLPNESTLASNYREVGMHYSDKKRRADFPVFKGDLKSIVFPEDPIYLDWDGRELKNRSSFSSSSRASVV